jgi:diguanylate cyclase (GGDEF)-like protein/PAS domain S-box-containing protein
MTTGQGSPRQMVAEVEEVLLRYVYPHRKRLARLAQAGRVTPAEVGHTLRSLTEAAAQTLGVERASVWRLRPDGPAEKTSIECLDLFQRTPGSHQQGMVIEADRAPSYFGALATAGVIAAHDVNDDPRTAELHESYLQPLGITSMLDAPAFVRGQALAVICHEHVGPARRWQFWEELVASTFADFVATVLELESRSQDALLREAHEQRLEREVAERTQALRDSEQNLQALLDAAPMPLVLTRASDHRVIYGNARAAALFEVEPAAINGLSAPDFWVDEQQRQAFVATLLSTGRADDVEVQLRSGKGRVFWARMNAQAVRFRGEVTLLGGMVDVTEQRQAQQNLRDIFASAPVALVLSRLGDRTVLDANQRAAALFDIPIEEARGQPAPDYWVQPEDRQRFAEATRAAGRIDGFEAQLRTRGGKRFWAELSAGIVDFDGQPALLVGASDISLRRRAQEALRRSESTLRTLLDAAPTPLVVTRLEDGVLRYCNERAASLFELTVEEVVGRRAPDFYVDAKDRRAFVEGLRLYGRIEGFAAQLRTSSGRAFWALMNAKTFDLEGDEVFMVGFAEMSAQKELEERLRTLATTDGLTGIFNRRHFLELAETELERAERYGHATSLAMVDIDHFKRINDELGHATGDAALRALTATLRKELRSMDVVARLGGEEFALLLPETPLRAALSTAERVRRAVAGRSYAEHGLPAERRVTVSVGVAERQPHESLAALLERADAGLYRAKSSGRDRVVAVD